MSQPPNEPPQGDFGAPQDRPPTPSTPPVPLAPPAQGEFGAPPDTPQGTPSAPAGPPAPGYGYPQQPGPYAGPGPYARPQQPAGPYAQPPQQPGPYTPPGPYAQSGPYAQPGSYGQQPAYGQQPGYGSGYGHPGQAQYPGGPGGPGTAAPPPGGSRNPFKGRPAVVIGAAVAALLVVGGGVWAVSGWGGDDGKEPVAQHSKGRKASPSADPVNPGDGSGNGGGDPENLNAGRQAGEAKVLWYKQAPDAPGSGAAAPGLWITDKAAVKAAYKQVFAYNVGDGKPTWSPLTFPQPICAVTPQKTSDDKVVVAYQSGAGDNAKCNQLQQIDLDTGAKGWSGKVADGALFDSTLTIELSVTGTTLMVGRSQSGTAYDITSGKKLWNKENYGQACYPTAFAGGAKLLSVAACGAGTVTEHDEVQELNPATGKARWTTKIPKGWRVERTYSVDPVVIYMTNKDQKKVNVTTFKDNGAVRSQLKSSDTFSPECGFALLDRDLTGCFGTAVDASTLYLPTEAKTGANEIVAFDLSTGKEKWRVKSPAAESMLPLKTDGTRLIAYVEPSYDAGGQIVSIPTTGTDHKPTKLLQNPRGTASVENGFFSKAVDYVDGRFYLSTTRLTGNDQSKEKLMLAYGK